jgi:hypothetical protein
MDVPMLAAIDDVSVAPIAMPGMLCCPLAGDVTIMTPAAIEISCRMRGGRALRRGVKGR